MEIEASSYLSSAAVQPGLCWSWSNYRLFSHGVVSYMFNEESDNVVLELRNNFTLLWIIAINAWCWRADCDVLIHDGAAGVN